MPLWQPTNSKSSFFRISERYVRSWRKWKKSGLNLSRKRRACRLLNAKTAWSLLGIKTLAKERFVHSLPLAKSRPECLHSQWLCLAPAAQVFFLHGYPANISVLTMSRTACFNTFSPFHFGLVLSHQLQHCCPLPSLCTAMHVAADIIMLWVFLVIQPLLPVCSLSLHTCSNQHNFWYATSTKTTLMSATSWLNQFKKCW